MNDWIDWPILSAALGGFLAGAMFMQLLIGRKISRVIDDIKKGKYK